MPAQISLRRSVRFPPRGLGAWLACLAKLLRGCWAQMRRHLVCAVLGRQMLLGPLKNELAGRRQRPRAPATAIARALTQHA